MSDTGSPPRRTLTTLQKLHVLTRYARCPMCGEQFGALSEIDFDHTGQLELTHDNSLENFRPLHREGCHKRKSAADSRARANVRHITKQQEEARRRMLAKDAGEPKPRSKWGSRPFPKRRKASK